MAKLDAIDEVNGMLADSVVFRSLGQVGSIVFRHDCGLCRCLFSLISPLSSPDKEVRLVLTWSKFIFEQRASIDTGSERATSKSIAAVAHPLPYTHTNTGIAIKAGSDGLCILATDPMLQARH